MSEFDNRVKRSYDIRISIYRIKRDEEGFWGAYDQNTNELYYGGAYNFQGIDGTQLLEVLRVVIEEWEGR